MYQSSDQRNLILVLDYVTRFRLHSKDLGREVENGCDLPAPSLLLGPQDPMVSVHQDVRNGGRHGEALER